MKPPRLIGIEQVPPSPWGTHFCLFYRTKEDLLDLLVPYFKAGLENNEFCMWVTSEPLRAKQARAALAAAVKDLDDYERRGQIEILDYTQWYVLDGKFDSDQVLAAWVEREQRALQNGFGGLRLTGNTFWLEEATWRAFIDYEAAVDSVISQHNMIALCTYSLDRCGASEVIDVTNHHQFALTKRAGKWEMIESADRRRAEEAQRYAAELERRVAERTSELQKLNASLKRENAERQQKEKELAKANRTLKAHNNSSVALMHAEQEKAYLEQVCRIIAQDCGHALVWIGLAEEDLAKTVRPVAYWGFDEGYIDQLQITWADTERGGGPTGTAIRTGTVKRCCDMLNDPQFEPWRAEALKRGYAASIALPLMADGKAFGAVTIYSGEHDPFSDDEVLLLSELAKDLAYGITTLRLRQAHAKAESALRQSEQRYRSLFERINEGFALHEVICDDQDRPVDYRFLEINPGFERLTGLKREEVIGKTARTVLPLIEDVWIQTYGQVALTGTPVRFDNYAAALQQHYEVFAYSPAPRQFAVLFMNITERKQAEAAIREAMHRIEKLNADLELQAMELQTANVNLEEQAEELSVANTNIEEALVQEHAARAEAEERRRALEQSEREIESLNRDLEMRAAQLEMANKELEAFSYSVSHDLRTPLRAVDNFANLLLQDYGATLDEGARNYMNLIAGNSKQMSELVEGLLRLSRLGRQAVERRSVEPAELVRQVIQDLAPQMEGRTVEVVVDDMPPCSADPVLLRQVFANLLSNAIKFTRQRPTAEIQIGWRAEYGSNRCVYFVRDNGVGFDPRGTDKLFGVFHRLHSEEEYEGTGIGLALVERIIRRHGGCVWAESRADEGATFYFTLG